MNYKPFETGKTFRITPPEHPASTDDRIDLIMQRGAFGSGEHETTESCLELLEILEDIKDSYTLDLGSGTGILALAALKLGASHAVCVDIEPKAIITAGINSHLNNLEDRITHVTGTLEAVTADEFDLILANIYGDILLAIARPLAAKLKSGGTLLLSGILWEYNFDVRQAYEKQGCMVVKNKLLEEFSTVLLTKSK